jgi:hypothetical protein
MRKYYSFLSLFCCLVFFCNCNVNGQSKDLKLVFIRHAERPENGDNLTCQGLNRSLQLPGVLYKKFGRPANVYVPSLGMGEVTKRTRMLQTISPFVIKYGLTVNSAYDEEDYKSVGKAVLTEHGTVLIVWEHKNIAPILEYLGVEEHLKWPSDDYDTIWIVTFHKGKAMLTVDSEHLHPAAGCPF